jgi:hypothetical protein
MSLLKIAIGLILIFASRANAADANPPIDNYSKAFFEFSTTSTPLGINNFDDPIGSYYGNGTLGLCVPQKYTANGVQMSSCKDIENVKGASSFELRARTSQFYRFKAVLEVGTPSPRDISSLPHDYIQIRVLLSDTPVFPTIGDCTSTLGTASTQFGFLVFTYQTVPNFIGNFPEMDIQCNKPITYFSTSTGGTSSGGISQFIQMKSLELSYTTAGSPDVSIDGVRVGQTLWNPKIAQQNASGVSLVAGKQAFLEVTVSAKDVSGSTKETYVEAKLGGQIFRSKVFKINTVGPGTKIPLTEMGFIPSVPGTFNLSVTIDPLNQVGDVNSGNNTMNIPVVVYETHGVSIGLVRIDGCKGRLFCYKSTDPRSVPEYIANTEIQKLSENILPVRAGGFAVQDMGSIRARRTEVSIMESILSLAISKITSD